MAIRISKTAFAETSTLLGGDQGNGRPRTQYLRITVSAEGPVVDGSVADRGIFGGRVTRMVSLLDGRYLNEDYPEIDPPTLENIAAWLADGMSMLKSRSRIVSVLVESTMAGESAEWLAEPSQSGGVAIKGKRPGASSSKGSGGIEGLAATF